MIDFQTHLNTYLGRCQRGMYQFHIKGAENSTNLTLNFHNQNQKEGVYRSGNLQCKLIQICNTK